MLLCYNLTMNASIGLEKLIETIKADGKTPSILLHACCAPCASYCLEYLTGAFDVTLFYYNPNITDKAEYELRLQELVRLGIEFSVKVIDGEYDGKIFFEHSKGLEKEPERGKRCEKCFALRLNKTKEIAGNNYDYFATTLTLSPLKNAELINAIGSSLEDSDGAKYLPTDFKKKGGYLRSIELSKKYNLYRQNYCGCVFSKRKD